MTTVTGSSWAARLVRGASKLIPGPEAVARILALACSAGALTVLSGHIAGIPALQSMGSGTRPLHPLAAFLFIAFGVYLFLAARSRPPRRLLHGFGVLLKVLCVTALVAQFLGWNLPLTPAPGVAGEPSGFLPVNPTNIALTFAFGCAALAAILLHGPHTRARNWMIVPLLPVFWATYLSLAANFYRVEHINQYFAHTLLPLPAAILFGFLLTGFLALQPRGGFMGALNGRYIGGVLARVAFPVILLTPFTVGWIRIRALKSGDYDMAAAFSQFATTNIIIFGTFVWFCAHMLNRIDARRQKTMLSLQHANGELQRVNSELQRVNAALKLKIDEQIRTEEARQKTELQLFQSQKMEAMGTLAAGIAHDFNNLLTIILLNTEDALEAAPENSPLRAPLGEIRKSGGRAAEVVRQIMTFGRKSPAGRSLVHLGDMVTEAAEMLRHGLPRNVTLRVKAVDDLPAIRADSTQVQQVLLNLGTNAAQAMAEIGGLLEISGDRISFRPGDVPPHPDLRPGDYVRLTVRDEGCGIDEETLKRVFDPFFTTKPPGKGTGLGLSVVHGIMQLHHGCVTAESTPGEGSSFSLYFPVSRPQGEDGPGDGARTQNEFASPEALPQIG